MALIETTVYCNGCGVEITWAPLYLNKQHYCCQDCYDGRPCECGSRLEDEDEHRSTQAAIGSGYPS